jgi:hypothetical protein
MSDGTGYASDEQAAVGSDEELTRGRREWNDVSKLATEFLV